jgi:hypothetical protein
MGELVGVDADDDVGVGLGHGLAHGVRLQARWWA